MLEIISSGLPYSLFPIDKAYEIGWVLIVVLTLVGFLILMILHGHEPSEMIEASIRHFVIVVILFGLFSTNIMSNHITPIQAFVQGTDDFTMKIALYIGGDPITVSQQVFNNYSKMVMDSKAFADALNPKQVGWWDYLGVKLTEPILAFTIGIIHVVELIILSVYAGAAAFVAVIRKILLDIELVVGFMIIPFLLVPSMRHWVKSWLFLVIETAAVIIPVALIIGAISNGIQNMFFNLSLDNTVTFFLFLALLAAGIYLVLHAATFTHNLLHGSAANLSSMIASAKAAASGRGATMGITHGAKNLEKGGALRGGYSGLRQGIADAKEIQKYNKTGGAEGKAPGDVKRAMAQQNLMTKFGHSVGSTGAMMKDKTASVIKQVPTIIRPVLDKTK